MPQLLLYGTSTFASSSDRLRSVPFYDNQAILSKYSNPNSRGGGALGKSVSPASGRLGVRIPAETDPCR